MERAVVIKARTLRGLDGVQRIDAELVRDMRGTPWGPVPGNPRGRLCHLDQQCQHVRLASRERSEKPGACT